MIEGAMVEAWWSPEAAGLVGGLAGAGVGLLGAGMGVAVSTLAQRGKGRIWVMGAQWVVALAGAVVVSLGVVAALIGQPYGVWFPLLIAGLVSASVFGGLMPVTRHVYRAAEQRRMEAEALRRS